MKREREKERGSMTTFSAPSFFVDRLEATDASLVKPDFVFAGMYVRIPLVSIIEDIHVPFKRS